MASSGVFYEGKPYKVGCMGRIREKIIKKLLTTISQDNTHKKGNTEVKMALFGTYKDFGGGGCIRIFGVERGYFIRKNRVKWDV